MHAVCLVLKQTKKTDKSVDIDAEGMSDWCQLTQGVLGVTGDTLSVLPDWGVDDNLEFGMLSEGLAAVVWDGELGK